MSRGFRDADSTQEMSGREADAAVKRLQSRGAEQARRSAELRSQGSYGVCETCREPIGKDRLEAVPEATRCVRCQASWEASQ